MYIQIGQAINKVYDKVAGWIEKLILLLPNILVAALIFVLFYLIGKGLRNVLHRPISRLSKSQILADLAVKTLSFAVVAVGFFVALSVLQLDKAVTSLLAGAGIVGLALGFAFQDIAANFVSGVLMAVQRPIQVNDVVETNGYFGTVVDINLRTTIVRTFQGQRVYIPNKDIYGQAVKNFSDEGARRIDLSVGVSYGDDLEKVRRLTVEAIEGIDLIDRERGVSFFYKEFGDSSINFDVRYWVKFSKQTDYLEALSEGIIRVKATYDANDIMIPFPIRTLDFGIKGGEKLSEQTLRMASENGTTAGSADKTN